MSTSNKKSTIISIRLSNEVVETLRKRIVKGRHKGISAYLRERITYDTLRKH